MLFKSIPGNNAVKERLIKQVLNHRISHAQLFNGAEGTAALPLALAYAQYILCKNRSETDACGVCASCNKMQKLIHPDVHFVFPTNTTKSVKKQPQSEFFMDQWREALARQAYQSEMQWYDFIGVENGQGNIPTVDAEKLIAKLSYKAYEGDYKIAIIWMAGRMNVESSNKLLKLLEEPPEGTVFILITADPSRLLRTIRSRVQEIPIPLDSGIAESSDIIEVRKEVDRFIYLCINRKPQDTIDLVALVEQLASKSRESIKFFLRVLLEQIRSWLFSAETGVDLSSSLQSGVFHVGNIQEIYEEVNLAHAQISQNGSSKIVLLDMAFQIRKLVNRI